MDSLAHSAIMTNVMANVIMAVNGIAAATELNCGAKASCTLLSTMMCARYTE